MRISTSSVFFRVNWRRPCRVCGKPNLRSYVRNGERISICMRMSDGARRINRHDGATFILRHLSGGFHLTTYNPASSDESAVRRNACFLLIFHDGVALSRDFS
jgi:hypothetical protein